MIPYDKRSGKIWYNGELVNWSDVKVHVLNHGLHYASCVFEGERVYDGSIFKLEEHTSRLSHVQKVHTHICASTNHRENREKRGSARMCVYVCECM